MRRIEAHVYEVLVARECAGHPFTTDEDET